MNVVTFKVIRAKDVGTCLSFQHRTGWDRKKQRPAWAYLGTGKNQRERKPFYDQTSKLARKSQSHVSLITVFIFRRKQTRYVTKMGRVWFCSLRIKLCTGAFDFRHSAETIQASDIVEHQSSEKSKDEKFRASECQFMHFKSRFDWNTLGCKVSRLVQIRWVLQNQIERCSVFKPRMQTTTWSQITAHWKEILSKNRGEQSTYLKYSL